MTAVITCQLKLSPECAGEAELGFTTAAFAATTCATCGQEFQRKYPHRLEGLAISALPACADRDGDQA